MPLLDKTVKRREASVLALSFCSLFSFSKQNLTELLALFPSVQHLLHRITQERIAKMEDTLSDVLSNYEATDEEARSLTAALLKHREISVHLTCSSEQQDSLESTCNCKSKEHNSILQHDSSERKKSSGVRDKLTPSQESVSADDLMLSREDSSRDANCFSEHASVNDHDLTRSDAPLYNSYLEA